MGKKVHLTGLHSGQNPSSGLGIARCLRRAYPDLRLVGVDHWQGSSGLHDPAINEVTLLPQWSQIDDATNVRWIRSVLDDGNLWIPALDTEIHWMAERIGAHRNLLGPGKTALEATAKPEVRAFLDVGFGVPEWIPADSPDSVVHAFLRKSAWQCWLKSPYHDAKPISSWGSFERARESLAKSWRTSNLFLQRHRVGLEETIAFAAYHGELVGAAHLEKRLLTPGGKTWAGRVTPVEPELYEKIREVVRQLEWAGGGELEFVRDTDGRTWIIECNPRFPAWIYGGALCGINLPAALLSRAWNLPLVEKVSTSYPFFTRVVTEIAARESVGIPLLKDPSSVSWASDGKFGKGGSASAISDHIPRLGGDESEDGDGEEREEKSAAPALPQAPQELSDEIAAIARNFQGETPARVFLGNWARKRFSSLAKRIASTGSDFPRIRIGYSVKTSPTDTHLALAKEHGFLAECISQKEVRRSIEYGWPASEVILNGPGKFWPLTDAPITGLHALYCDSLEEFERVSAIPGIAKVLGFRMRLPKLSSRFGNELGEFARFRMIVEGVRKLPRESELGFHFHMPSWSIGVERWMDGLQALLFWCQSIENLSGVPIRRLDLGGGFFPDDLGSLDFARVQAAVHEALPGVTTLYFEPGRALTQETEALVARVLDVRIAEHEHEDHPAASKREAKAALTGPDEPDGKDKKEEWVGEWVIDACVAELPLARAFPHRFFYQSSESGARCEPLKKGPSRVLGRICMEDDILGEQLLLPHNAQIGDLVVIADAGGYERSMAYVFGRG